MSVASRNPFALLNDDDAGEPDASPRVAESKAEAATPAAQKNQRAKSGPASRGGRYYARGGGVRTEGRENQEGASADTAAPRDKKGERGRGGRGGRGRGDRGGRGRQYDRHSGTLPDSDKKVNQGWGAPEGGAELDAERLGNDDAAKEETPVPDGWGADTAADTSAPADGWGAAIAEGGAPKDSQAPGEGVRRQREEEEEDNSLTLEEYLASQKAKESNIPKLEGRKIDNDNSLWADAIAITRENEDNYFVGKGKAAPKQRSKKEEKVFLEIEARFDRPSRGGRGRGRGGDRGGDRGFGDRGGGGRGRGRGDRGAARNNASSTSVDVDDQAAFPSLS